MTENGAEAITDIPTGARSAPFIFANISIRNELVKTGKPTQIGVWQSGEIRPANLSVSHCFWPKLIQLAADCHEQNVRICRWQHDTVILQATRTILTGQKLFLWFGEDLLLQGLGIPPYLNPINIRGGDSYVCHNCGNEFVAPNPLKIHLALECGTLSVDNLWTRLANHKATSCLNLLLTPNTSVFPFTVRAPYFIPPQVTGTPPLELEDSPRRVSPSSSNSQRSVATPENKSLTDQHAHLESIVSNMGKAKNGHVCLYCGKLYSRKYGLKIHIRTHTGYKPLHCRICHRAFGDPSNLNKHVRLHSDGNTPYRCDFCSKVLVRRRDLDRHIRSRHNNIANSARNFTMERNRGRNTATITAATSSTVNGAS